MRVPPAILPTLRTYLEERARYALAGQSQPDADGWVTLDLPFESFVTARTRLPGLGRAVEVLAPEPLRKSLVDFAGQIVGFYQEREHERLPTDRLGAGSVFQGSEEVAKLLFQERWFMFLLKAGCGVRMVLVRSASHSKPAQRLYSHPDIRRGGYSLHRKAGKHA